MSDNTTRRRFLKASLATTAVLGGGGACLCGLSICRSKTPKAAAAAVTLAQGTVKFELAKAPELETAGGSVRILHDGLLEPILVARTSEDTYVATSMKCTHFGMPLGYDHASGKLRCASLGHSLFSLDGKVAKGPAEQALKVYPSALKDGVLEITL